MQKRILVRPNQALNISFICLIYLIVNIVFNQVLWKQIFTQENSQTLTIQGESFIYEYFAETVRQNILAGKNPFTPIANILYPFGWSITFDDVAPINGIFFLMLRPFFSLHQSLTIIVVISVFLSNISMYWLSKIMGIRTRTAFLSGLIFGFTPFMGVRIGAHQTYTALYLFPITLIPFILMIKNNNHIMKMIHAIFLGAMLALCFFTNLYYAVMLAVMIFLMTSYFLFFRLPALWRLLCKNFKYLSVTGIIFFVLTIPWILKAYEYWQLTEYTKPISQYDVIFHSADLTSIFVPSRLNPLYKPILTLAAKSFPKLVNLFENFIYPGIIILMFYSIFCIFFKKIPRSVRKKVFPFFTVSIAFLLFTLGPQLHIFGKNVDIPLPYSFITKLPIFQMARAPGRFIVPFVFLATIVTGYLIDYAIEKKYKSKKTMLFALLIAIFFLDQSYTISLPPTIYIPLPTKIYQHLKTENHKTPILEIPFDIRDGLKNLGSFYSPWLTWAQLLHQQPTFSIYGGRINNQIFAYYKTNPLFGPIGQLTDRDVKNFDAIASQFDIKKMKTVIDFFGIEYIIIKEDEKYSYISLSLAEKLGFEKIKTDRMYSLWYQNTRKNIDPQFDFGSDTADLFLATGWSPKEARGRWAVGKTATVLLHKRNLAKSQSIRKLSFIVQSYPQKQSLNLFINNNKVKKINLDKKPQTHTIDISKYLQDGFNIIIFKFAKTKQPTYFNPRSADTRELAAFFSDITITPLLSSKQN